MWLDYKKDMSTDIILWFFITSLIVSCTGESVSLTVEGGGSLVGEHCPGIVRLFCEGIDLNFLRISYNGNVEISTFFPDSQPLIRTNLNNPAFLSVNLSSVSPNSQVANYSVILTIDVSELQGESIENIVCGNADVMKTESVNVTIRPEQVPDIPQISAVNLKYESNVFTSLKVTWDKAKNVCSAYANSLSYEVRLNSSNPSQRTINYTSCGEESCTTSFTNSLQLSNVSVLTITTVNNAGSSDPEVYPVAIDEVRSPAFRPTVLTSDCLIVGYCNTTCSVQYTTDSSYNNFIHAFNNIEFFSISRLSPNTTYYFEFSFLLNRTLFVIDRLQIITDNNGVCDSQAVENSNTVVIIIVVVVMLSVIVICVVVGVVFTLIVCRKNTGGHAIQSESETNSEDLVEMKMEEASLRTESNPEYTTPPSKTVDDHRSKSTPVEQKSFFQKTVAFLDSIKTAFTDANKERIAAFEQ